MQKDVGAEFGAVRMVYGYVGASMITESLQGGAVSLGWDYRKRRRIFVGDKWDV